MARAGNIPIKLFRPSETVGPEGQISKLWGQQYGSFVYAQRFPVGGQFEIEDDQEVAVVYDLWRIRRPRGSIPEPGWRLVDSEGTQHVVEHVAPIGRTHLDIRTTQSTDPEDVE